MIARRLSLALSILAVCLMALACSLGYKSVSEDRPPEALRLPDESLRAATGQDSHRCQRLSEQLTTCTRAVGRAWRPVAPAHYPHKIQALLAIKGRYALQDDALRACRGASDDPGAEEALDSCMKLAGCDEFANCLADSVDDF